jgi:hypothetical protein
MHTKQNISEVSGVELTKIILIDLQKLSSCSGEPIASVYADNLLRTMRTMGDKLPFDPYTQVIMTLHDALFYSNRWIDYNTSQYQGVCELLTSLVNQETINNSSVETAILTLEELGFDTLPFVVTLDESLDINQD